ncbi:MAG: RHS repeat-associated core domain-containing protein, partial [Lachnospiraceae bacterium]|nr:RHS repeat-associated core domain-containing protein [Lachnospiraceae bacterium]
LEKREDVGNRILYTAQQYDQETGQYYLRARYYNPVVGRFLQEDTYRGDGLNLYAYCANNPVVYYDPSGHGVTYEEGGVQGTGGTPGNQIVTNSAGKQVIRDYVNSQDELLEEAEKAAGGNLDDFIEIKPGWYQDREGTIKIEWNPEGHANTNEGPHVTVRERNERGGWNVIKKIFIRGRDNYH